MLFLFSTTMDDRRGSATQVKVAGETQPKTPRVGKQVRDGSLAPRVVDGINTVL
jgi:hypothetical protein